MSDKDLGAVSHAGADDFEIAEYCARLTCHKTIVQPSGRGRRREFCSETCRRSADRDYKRAKALVEHFERYLRKTRHEVAAYGRRADAEDGMGTPEDDARCLREAEVAVERARTIVEFSKEPDPYLDELRCLVEAVRPLVRATAHRATA